MPLQSCSKEELGFDNQVHLHKTQKMPSCLSCCFFLADTITWLFSLQSWKTQSVVTSSVGFESQGTTISLVVLIAAGEQGSGTLSSFSFLLILVLLSGNWLPNRRKGSGSLAGHKFFLKVQLFNVFGQLSP